ncbi:MAG: hypothetical protein GF404_08445 [candidate division Zixibacteria bacterium]|nr:hypothetical protein [candidate division Zixibacteria bacterium]
MSVMGLFSKPDFQSDDPDVRLKAVKECDDQSLLAEIAKNDSAEKVRLASVEKLNDQDSLYQVAREGNEIDARIAAVEKIDSQQRLADLIREKKNYRLMKACFAHITDKRILEKIAHDKEYNMAARRMAIENYADESFIGEFDTGSVDSGAGRSPDEIEALVEKYGAVRLARALGKFRGSPNAIRSLGIIMNRSDEAAELALEAITQALGHANAEVRSAAEAQLKQLDDGDLIAHLISLMEDSKLHSRIMGVLKLIDHPEARQFVKSSGSEEHKQ